MKLDLDDIERKARAATGGEWAADRVPGMPRADEPILAVVVSMEIDDRGRQQQVADCYDNTHCSDHQNAANAAHIAANSPPVTLALIARIRELEAEVDRAADLLEAGSDRGARRSWAAGLRESVEKGVVLP